MIRATVVRVAAPVTALLPSSSDMDAREHYLSEQPVAVLQAHAQECGINVSGCLEKRDLVQRILRSEPQEVSGAAGRSPPASLHHTSRSLGATAQNQLAADERLARQLQAEEADSVRRTRAETRSGETALRSGGTQSSNTRSLLALLAAAQASQQRGASRRTSGEGATTATVATTAATATAGGDATVQNATDVDVAAQSLMNLIGQALAHEERRGGAAGAQILTELMGSLMQRQQGLDGDAINARTITTKFNERAMSGAGSSEDDNRKCMVCLETFQDNEELRVLPCLHRYHKACVDPWLARDRHCPVCKYDIMS